MFILDATPTFANDSISIEFGEFDVESQSISILYNSDSDIAGFQLFLVGIDVSRAYGGLAEENDFYLHHGSTCWRDDGCKDFVTGFSLTDSKIPSGTGVLFYVDYSEIGDELYDDSILVGDTTCLDSSEGFVAGPDGNNFDIEVGECTSSPIDCNGDYYGSSEYDTCDVCSGGNSGHVADSDIDACGDCFGGVGDFDGDGMCDTEDDDDDNDGALDENDSDDYNANVCSDNDNDTCEDCIYGHYDTFDDGDDNDEDGLCDAGDPDDDNDGALDENDSET